MEHVFYASSISSLMYVMVFTRLDIDHGVGVLSIYMSKIRKEFWTIIKRVFRYLCGTIVYAIYYQGKPETTREVNVHVFFNVDEDGDMD
jgi:hypothetical protein